MFFLMLSRMWRKTLRREANGRKLRAEREKMKIRREGGKGGGGRERGEEKRDKEEDEDDDQTRRR